MKTDTSQLEAGVQPYWSCKAALIFLTRTNRNAGPIQRFHTMTVNSLSSQTSAASSSGTPASAAATAASATSGLASQQTFLQLLVAQIKNQDPTQPADAIQFVSQLAQFSSLEQELQMRQDLDQLATSAAGATKTN